MQEMQHPDGAISREFFTDEELKAGKMEERRRQLEAEGYQFNRTAYITKPKENPRYPVPHQGAQEIERRRKRIEELTQRIAAEEAKANAAIVE